MPSSPPHLFKKYAQHEQAINRLRARKAALEQTLKKHSYRKARTRTLIQVGGLVSLAGLFDLCDIQEGDDLQENAQDKAALLLGFLMEKRLHHPPALSPTQKDSYLQQGIRYLKQTAYQKLRRR